MRNRLMLVALCTATSVVLAATAQLQPLNVKTGLWHMTKAIKWTDLPPQMAAMMKGAPQTSSYDACVTTKDLTTNPFANGSGDDCTWTVLSSTSSDMELRGTGCQFGNSAGMAAEVHGQIHVLDPENGTGSMTVTLSGNGQTMHGVATYTGKWFSASCPAH